MNLNKPHWTQSDYNEFVEYLKTLADEKYRQFSDGLVPGAEFSIGIRMPMVRTIAKDISKGNYAEFLRCSMGKYHSFYL